MADSIKIKATMLKNGTLYPPQKAELEDRELAFHRSEEALYIGNNGDQVKLCRASDIETIKTKLTANQVVSLSGLSSGATLEQVVAKYNELISALKTSGVMKT